MFQTTNQYLIRGLVRLRLVCKFHTSDRVLTEKGACLDLSTWQRLTTMTRHDASAKGFSSLLLLAVSLAFGQ